jgi:hypothetical protein
MSMLSELPDAILSALVAKRPGDVDDPYCSFCLYEDTSNGMIAAALDTVNNSLLHAKRKEKQVLRELSDTSARANYDELIMQYMALPVYNIFEYNTSFSNMKHHIFQEYYHELVEDTGVTRGALVRMLVSISSHLLATGAFSQMHLASPFRVGICSWESSDMWVVRVINWPAHSGPRV